MKVELLDVVTTGDTLALLLGDWFVEFWLVNGPQPVLLSTARSVRDLTFLGRGWKALVHYFDDSLRLVDLELVDELRKRKPEVSAICAAVRRSGNWTPEDQRAFTEALIATPQSCK